MRTVHRTPTSPVHRTPSSEADRRIRGLKHSVYTNDACCLCGGRTDPTGIDPAIGTALVCDPCCAENDPEVFAAIQQVRRVGGLL